VTASAWQRQNGGGYFKRGGGDEPTAAAAGLAGGERRQRQSKASSVRSWTVDKACSTTSPFQWLKLMYPGNTPQPTTIPYTRFHHEQAEE
jgi:hypothetical protein